MPKKYPARMQSSTRGHIESERNVPHFISQDSLSALIKRDVTDVSGGTLGSSSYDKVVFRTANSDITDNALTKSFVKL